jgi:hypothetical protein
MIDRCAEQHAGAGHKRKGERRDAHAVAVGDPAGERCGQTVDEQRERERPGDRAPAPAEIVFQRPDEHAGRGARPVAATTVRKVAATTTQP